MACLDGAYASASRVGELQRDAEHLKSVGWKVCAFQVRSLSMFGGAVEKACVEQRDKNAIRRVQERE